MIRLFRKIRNQLLAEDNYPVYLLYASGEILLVVVGILLALTIDNWNDKRVQKKTEIENIENLYFTLNESMQLESLMSMFEYAKHGDQLWMDFLEGKTPYSDSLLDYGYFIGSTASITQNSGFYESLKAKGLETIDDKEIRLRLSVIYEQNLPEIQKSMDNFMSRFDEERTRIFRKYFVLGTEFRYPFTVSQNMFDYSMYSVAEIKNREEMMADMEFLEFVRISYLFHEGGLYRMERILDHFRETQARIFYELNFLKYGSPARKEIKLQLSGYEDAETVYASGDFNNWRPDAPMLRTPKGWERSFQLFPGTYEYKFIVNGIWIVDPANPDSVFVPEVNSYNSLLKIEE